MAVTAGRSTATARTRRLLLETTAELLARGDRPSVTQVADAAGVSRRTAYRYFATPRKMHADAALEKLRPVIEAAMNSAAHGASQRDVQMRIDMLVRNMQQLTVSNEVLLRTIIHETVLMPPSSVPRRGNRRLDWIQSAVGPLRPRLGKSRYERLVAALALCVGIEALLVLRDICGLTPRALVEQCRWMCSAMVKQSLIDRSARTTTPRGTPNRRGQGRKADLRTESVR